MILTLCDIGHISFKIVESFKNIYYEFRSSILNEFAAHMIDRFTILQVFKVGQSYKIVIDMDVPESDANTNAGLFI